MREWTSAVPALAFDAIDDSAEEATDELVALVVSLAAHVGVGLDGVAAIDLAAVDLVELYRSIKGHVDEHDGQRLLQGGLAHSGNLVVTNEVGGQEGGADELNDVVGFRQLCQDLSFPFLAREDERVLPPGEDVVLCNPQAGLEQLEDGILSLGVIVGPREEQSDVGHVSLQSEWTNSSGNAVSRQCVAQRV